MKIEVTEDQLASIVNALREYGLSYFAANIKHQAQKDPADDGPEVAILCTEWSELDL